MKRLIAYFKGQFVNLPADRIEEREGFIYAYSGNELIGTFDMGYIDAVYLSTPDTKYGTLEN